MRLCKAGPASPMGAKTKIAAANVISLFASPQRIDDAPLFSVMNIWR